MLFTDFVIINLIFHHFLNYIYLMSLNIFIVCKNMLIDFVDKFWIRESLSIYIIYR